MQSGHLVPEFAPDVAAFGHTLAAGEPPDHLAIEPACFDYLKVKQALAPYLR